MNDFQITVEAKGAEAFASTIKRIGAHLRDFGASIEIGLVGLGSAGDQAEVERMRCVIWSLLADEGAASRLINAIKEQAQAISNTTLTTNLVYGSLDERGISASAAFELLAEEVKRRAAFGYTVDQLTTWLGGVSTADALREAQQQRLTGAIIEFGEVTE